MFVAHDLLAQSVVESNTWQTVVAFTCGSRSIGFLLTSGLIRQKRNVRKWGQGAKSVSFPSDLCHPMMFIFYCF